MSPSRLVTCLLALLLAPLLAMGASSPLDAGQDAAAPLRNEDVVRMLAGGSAIDVVLDAIKRAATTQFELDPDMLIELRRAEVPESVIAAMIARQRETAGAAPAGAAQLGAFEVEFQKPASAELRKGTVVILENDPGGHPVELAFFVICTDPLHVPDQWHTLTPLRAAFPRHEMLWFLQATRPGKPIRRARTIYLELPDRQSVPIAAGSHSLLVGIAARSAGSEWMPLSTVTAKVEVKPPAAPHLVLLVRTAKVGQVDPTQGPTPWITCEVVRSGP